MKALLIIDVQNDFIRNGSLAVNKAERIIPIINKLLQKFDYSMASKDCHPQESVHFKKWPPHCVAGTTGAAFPFDLDQEKINQILYKGTSNKDDGYSAFEANNINLIEHLQEKGITDLYICGIALEFCVKSTVLDALEKRLNVYMLKDAIAPFSEKEEEIKQYYSELENAGAKIISSTAV
ncbi:MAG: isochorismatase family protein [Atribacterota bacterium]|nr:isochorismatase family protein [Atribacterota bacterium]